MAENKTKPTRASVPKFLAGIEHDRRREDALAVCELMKEVTGESPVMWGDSLVGFGTYAYRYATGRTGDWPLVAFSPRKASMVLYIMSGFGGHAELMAKLGKHKTGSSCLYVNKLADVDTDILRELVRRSVDHVSKSSS